MGFDNECILNIQTLAGEYFCPVCRLLVYPNEALQSQCTHLYCKPCLTYVVGTTQACPYDGYLVTEADAKPLVESNKALAETIGKIVVHCLYHRSGCTWQGPLSECSSHCSSCAFGNSPVICNRCAVQIVHCQVQEHAQSCPGVPAQAQQAEAAPSTSASGAAATAVQTQTATQAGAATSHTLAPQTAIATIPGADPNQKANASSQAQAVVQAAVPTAEQWYQQQYQQYYQQYPGYDPYLQQYYPYLQPAILQSQQQPLQANQAYGIVQPQPQAYLQPLLQPQPQLQTQTSQSQAQPQPQVQPPLAQAPVSATTQNQALVNQQLQLQLQPAASTHSQIQTQTYPPSHGQAHFPPQAYFQPQSHAQPRPQNVQMPQHQQTQVQQPQVQQHTQSQLQPPLSQLQPPLLPSQPMNTTVQSQTQHPSSNALIGNHTFPQSHLHQPVLSAVPLQRPMQIQSQGVANSQSLNAQTQIPFPQQPPLLRPPSSQVTMSNQQQTVLPSPISLPVQQPVHSYAQQPGIPVQQRPIMQPVQQLNPQQYFHNQPHAQQRPLALAQSRPQGQSQSFQQHIRAPIQSQQNVVLSQGTQLTQSPNLVGRPMLPSHGVQSQPYAQTIGGVPLRPMYPAVKLPTNFQNNIVRTNNKEKTGANSRLTERPAEKEAGLSSQNVVHELSAPSVVVDSEVKTVNSEVDVKSIDDDNKPSEDQTYQGDTSAKEIPDSTGISVADPQHVHADGESVRKPALKEEGADGALLDSNNGKLGEVVAEGANNVPNSGMEQGAHKEIPSEKAQLPGAQDRKLQKDASDTEQGSQIVSISTAPTGQVQAGNFMQPSHPGSAVLQQRPGAPPHHTQGSGHPSINSRPQGPGQPFHQSEHFQPPRGNQGFAASSGSASQHGPYTQSHAPPLHLGAPRGPPFGSLPPRTFDSHGVIAAPHGHEGQRSQQRPGFQMEHGAIGHPSGINPNMLRMNGNQGLESSSTLGFRDERFKALPDDRLNPFPGDSRHAILDRLGFEDDLRQFPRPSYLDSEPVPKFGSYASRPFDRVPLRLNHDNGPNTDPAAGPRFLSPYGHRGTVHANDTGRHPDLGGRHFVDGMAPRSPIRDYPGLPSRGFRRFGPDDIDAREFHRFGVPPGNSFHESRFPNLHNHLRRGEFEGPGNMRMDDHMMNNFISQDDHPGHLRRGEHLGPHNLPSHLRLREPVGFGIHPRHAGPGSFESFISNRPSHLRLGEPGFRSSFSLQRFPNDGSYTGELESFDHSRKRMLASTGWCRICKVDCETVEGLDLHSQTREHQRMAMDMVQTIKQNAKKRKLTSGDQSSVEDANKSKISSSESRGEKH